MITDEHCSHAKAEIPCKVRGLLEAVHEELRKELTEAARLAPPGVDPSKCQFV